MILKYRAWDKDAECMIYQRDNGGEYVWDIGAEDIWICYVYDGEIPEQVLMQSTGLKDKNGVEIFEGDIIGSQDKDRPNWYVSHHKFVWHDAGFMGKQIGSSSFIGLDFWTRGENGYVVIGNIYENPELLERS